jgi:hypothetical protein
MPDSTTPDQPKGLAAFGSWEELRHDWTTSKDFLKMPTSARQASIDALQQRWNVEQATRQQATATEQANQPDFFGRLNQAAGKLPFPENIAAQTLIPPSNTQAAIDVALFTAGGPVGDLLGPIAEAAPEFVRPAARLASRLAFPAAAGAVGGAIQGGVSGAGWGAVSGAAQQAVGEVASTAFGIARRAIQRADVEGIGQWLDKHLTDKPLLQRTYKTVSDIVRDFNGGELDETYRNSLHSIQNKIPTFFPVPLNLDPEVVSQLQRSNPTQYANMNFNVPVPFRQATKVLEDVEDIGWDWRFKMHNGKKAMAARSAVHQAEDTIAEELDMAEARGEIPKGTAVAWGTARHKYALSRAMSNLFREPGVIKNGKMDIQKVQELLADAGPLGYKMDLDQSVSPVAKGELRDLTRTVTRGGPAGSTDIMGERPNLRLGIHGILRPPGAYFHPGTISRHTGYIPFDLGRGRAFAAMQILGAHEFVNRLGNLFQDEQPAGGVANNATP